MKILYLDGKNLVISSTKGEVVSDGKLMIIKGKGLPFYKDTMSTGNLNISFTVKFPS